MPIFTRSRGVTLIETIVFLVVMAVALTALAMVFDRQQTINQSVDAAVRLRALELAQAKLDEILPRPFDENTPAGGIPACGSLPSAPVCLGIAPDSDMDDVGDFNGQETTNGAHTITVSVVDAGADFGLGTNQVKLISVYVSRAGNSPLVLSAYRVNY